MIKHDSEISKVSEYEELTEDLIKDSLKRESIGGTSHKPVFEFVRDYTKKHDENISMFIGLTDLCSDIQENQDIMPNNIPVFWITNTDFITSEKVSKGIRGQIINMEV